MPTPEEMMAGLFFLLVEGAFFLGVLWFFWFTFRKNIGEPLEKIHREISKKNSNH